MFDNLNNVDAEYNTINKVISLGHSDIYTFTNKLGEKLTELLKTLNVDELIIISHL